MLVSQWIKSLLSPQPHRSERQPTVWVALCWYNILFLYDSHLFWVISSPVPIIINGPSCALFSVCVMVRPAGFLMDKRVFHSIYCSFILSLGSFDKVFLISQLKKEYHYFSCSQSLPLTPYLITAKPPCLCVAVCVFTCVNITLLCWEALSSPFLWSGASKLTLLLLCHWVNLISMVWNYCFNVSNKSRKAFIHGKCV